MRHASTPHYSSHSSGERGVPPCSGQAGVYPSLALQHWTILLDSNRDWIELTIVVPVLLLIRSKGDVPFLSLKYYCCVSSIITPNNLAFLTYSIATPCRTSLTSGFDLSIYIEPNMIQQVFCFLLLKSADVSLPPPAAYCFICFSIISLLSTSLGYHFILSLLSEPRLFK